MDLLLIIIEISFYYFNPYFSNETNSKLPIEILP